MYLDHIHPPYSLLLPSHTGSFPSFLLVLPLFYSYDPPRPCICVCGSVTFISDSQEYGWGLVYRSRGTLPVATPLEKNNTVNCVYPQWGWVKYLHMFWYCVIYFLHLITRATCNFFQCWEFSHGYKTDINALWLSCYFRVAIWSTRPQHWLRGALVYF